MASRVFFTCKYCKKANIKSYAGLKQHIASVKRCCELSLLDGDIPELPALPVQPPLDNVDNQQLLRSGSTTCNTRKVRQENGAEVPDPGEVVGILGKNNSRDPRQMDNVSDDDAITNQ